MRTKQLFILYLLATGLTACGGGTSTSDNSDKHNIVYGQLLNAQTLSTESNIQNIASGFTLNVFNSGFASAESAGAKINMENSAKLYNFGPLEPHPNFTAFESYIIQYTNNAQVTSINSYAIQYNTPGVNNLSNNQDLSRIVSGLVIVPTMVNGIAPRGIVVFYHPTTISKNNVPSCVASAADSLPEYCTLAAPAPATNSTYLLLAATYAARGFVVVAPDYVGQGIDNKTIHPYVAFPENNAMAGINMITASRRLLANLGTPLTTKLPLFFTGFSEGGAYALKASQLAQTTQQKLLDSQNLDLTMTAPAEGAYSLSTQMSFAFSNLKDGLFNGSYANTDMMNTNHSNVIPGVAAENNWNIVSSIFAAGGKPVLIGDVMSAIIYYDFANSSVAYSNLLADQYWQSIPVNGSGNFSLYQLFSTPTLTDTQIESALISNTNGINGYNPAITLPITLYVYDLDQVQLNLPPLNWGTNNSASAFVNYSATQSATFKQLIESASTYKWRSQSPINFIHLSYDSLVTVANTDIAYSYMREASVAGMIESTVIPNFQMTNSVAQYLPQGIPDLLPAQALSKFWAPAISLPIPDEYQALVGNNIAQPTDHINLMSFTMANIIALCTFENALQKRTNSGVCPNFENK